jgi:hypothetical protein
MLITGVLLCSVSCLFRNDRFSRATIEDRTTWFVEERCADLGCYPHADFLIGNGITVRLQPLNYLRETIIGDFFLIRVMFPDGEKTETEFDPNMSAAALGEHRSITAKGIRCMGMVLDRSYLLSTAPIVGLQRIRNDDYCYYLFFNVKPPSVDDTFELTIKGVRQQGLSIEIPKVVFRPGNR